MAFSMLMWTISPALAAGDGLVDTELTRGQGGGTPPIIKAKWEMNGPYSELKGTDDDPADGAQFDAPGVWNGTRNYSICVVVTDPDGVDQVNGVYADVYYPEEIAFHPEDPNYPDQDNGGTDSTPDYGLSGCGAQLGDEIQLSKLDKDDGYELFCDTIRNNNNNLPTFYENPLGTGLYDYNEICDPDGELMKETAYVYCADASLRWEDPAGDYRIDIFADDSFGSMSDVASNYFTYLPLTAYEVDFSNVNYGEVQLNTHKRIPGDLDFGTTDRPTVRNIGNTRLYMKVKQDDMGLGTTDGVYNVKYDARVGNNEADWKDYYPEEWTVLEDILDLSQTEEMDFSILVTKFPSTQSTWTGTMTLGADEANFRECSCPNCP